MKNLIILSATLLALVPAVSGTATPVNAGATAAQSIAQTASLSPELIQVLKAQAASGDATLPRPL